MSADSRRSSSSSTSNSQPSTPSSGPSTPTGKSPPSFGPIGSFSRYNSSTKRKLNPVRRCQSMKNPNGLINGTNGNGGNGSSSSGNSSFSSLSSTPSFRSRRVSSTPSSFTESSRSHTETDFVKYYQYKIDRPEASLPFTLMISNDSQENQNTTNIINCNNQQTTTNTLVNNNNQNKQGNFCIAI